MIIAPIKRLLHSSKFLLAMADLVITLLAVYTGLPEEVIVRINQVFISLIAAIAIEDAAAKLFAK